MLHRQPLTAGADEVFVQQINALVAEREQVAEANFKIKYEQLAQQLKAEHDAKVDANQTALLNISLEHKAMKDRRYQEQATRQQLLDTERNKMAKDYAQLQRGFATVITDEDDSLKAWFRDLFE